MSAGDYQHAIDAASRAIEAGNLPLASALASACLARSQAQGDLKAQAWAFYHLGWVDLLSAKLGSALSLAQQSAHHFHIVSDSMGEVLALSQVSHVATMQGLIEEAIENATLAVQITESQAPGRHTALAYNYLGIATMWSNPVQAEEAFSRACELAQAHMGEMAQAQPLMNRLLNELFRLENCIQSGQPAIIRPEARAWRAEFDRLLAESALVKPLSNGITQRLMLHMQPLIQAGCAAHEGCIDAAQLASLPALVQALPLWTRCVGLCVQARCQLLAGQLIEAADTLAESIELATRHGQSQFMLIALCQRAEAHERGGEPDRALAALREFRRHQVRLQAEAVATRERVASLRLAWRRQARTLLELQNSSRDLERLSLEDSLTGLANRRCLERVLSNLLDPNRPEQLVQDPPWCLVLMDIDNFKQINDQFSHVVGDEVLRQMAQMLRRIVRQQDLAARLAGDEFVLILRDTPLELGMQVVTRLRQEILVHDWSAAHAGLRVRASIGLAQVKPDDTHASLLRRSDMRMYADKLGKRKPGQPGMSESPADDWTGFSG